LKTNALRWLVSAWRLLTEVPGWPDAPPALRLRRSLPLLLPLLGVCALQGWEWRHAAPRLAAAYRDHEELLALERSVAGLRLAFSEEQVAALVEREGSLRRQLPRDVAEVKEILHGLEREAHGLGWQLAFRVPSAVPHPEAGEALVELPVRCRLKPLAGNRDPFGSLLAVVERCARSPRRIGLMRMSISADEGKWQTVDLGLRFVLPVSHAQTAQ
jgi:Tfp pilus assembly protein PilO